MNSAIPLSAVGPGPEEDAAKDAPAALERDARPVDLHQALRHRHLVIIGDPGAGKTTFLRRIACELGELPRRHGWRPDRWVTSGGSVVAR